MPKLIYSPYYDGNCYAGNPALNECVIGTKYVGPKGLLDELELRAGLSRGEIPPMQRTIAYCNAIQDVLNDTKDKPFYQQSFENDPLGVAQQLLCWRDALCMAGWSQNTKLVGKFSQDGEKRLKDLQEIEAHFHSIGDGERWHILLTEAQNRRILPADVSIEVDMKMELLHPIIRKVLEEIKNKGWQITESKAATALGNKPLSEIANKKFTLYEFPEQTDAYQWATLQAKKADVYINEDNFTLNQVLKSVGMPLVSASVNGATDMLQLLKLGISLFRSPINYSNLLNYLNIFRHPIDSETRSALRYHLKDVGGFGDMTKKDGTLTKINDTAKNYLDFWGMWEHGNKDTVAVGKVKKFCKDLQEWAKKTKKKAEAERIMSPLTGTQVYAQLVLLQEKIELMLSFLDGRTNDIKYDELDKVVSVICQDGLVSTDFARLKSINMLSDLKGLATNVDTVIWMDCVRKPRPRYEYAFLNPADIKVLQANKLDIPGADLEILASDFAEQLAVSRAKRIIALMPQRKDGERTDEHLLITELCHTIPGGVTISTPGLPKGNPITAVPADTQKVEHIVDKNLFSNIETKPDKNAASTTTSKSSSKPVGYQRDYESFSSLSELINQPFDYVLDYIYNMKDEDNDNLSKLEGNVAHIVINQMVTACSDAAGNVDTNSFLSLCHNTTILEQKTDQAIHDIGAMLLQPENEMECTIFKQIFIQKSIPTLAQIIQKYALEIEGSEKEFTTVLTDSSGKNAFNFNAKIDFLLKRKSKKTKEYEYLIFDFKWTKNPNKRAEELKKRKELQLALYQKIAEANGKCPVVMRGYYLLKQAKLLTTYMDFFAPPPYIKIVEQEKDYDIFEQAVKSYRERISNLKEGFIEEGEEKKGPEFEKTAFIKDYILDSDNYYLNNGIAYSKKDKRMTVSSKNSAYGKNAVLKGKIR